jgi:hypothetical protein
MVFEEMLEDGKLQEKIRSWFLQTMNVWIVYSNSVSILI